jgi:hypothetical protein
MIKKLEKGESRTCGGEGSWRVLAIMATRVSQTWMIDKVDCEVSARGVAHLIEGDVGAR